MRLPRAAAGEPVFLTHAQVEQLAQACPGYELFVRVLICTGPRWGEATAVRVRRLDLVRRRIEVVHTAIQLNGEVTYGTPTTHGRECPGSAEVSVAHQPGHCPASAEAPTSGISRTNTVAW